MTPKIPKAETRLSHQTFHTRDGGLVDGTRVIFVHKIILCSVAQALQVFYTEDRIRISTYDSSTAPTGKTCIIRKF